MKSFIHRFTLILTYSLIVTQSWASPARSAKTLPEFPSQWDGIAGDLLNQIPASFTISRIRQGSAPNIYDVLAVMNLGGRQIQIKEIKLDWDGPSTDDITEVLMTTEDELVPYVVGRIIYDAATATYSFWEAPLRGFERRFSLKAKAR